MHFGSSLDNALERAIQPGKGKKPLSETQMNSKVQQTLAKWLGTEAVQKRYRDPMAKVNRER
jgi:hypothetical protein